MATLRQGESIDTPTAKSEWDDLVYTGPGTLAGRYMRLFWHPIYIAEDLPVGRPKPIRVMSQDFTLYKGESGNAHVVAFRCAHRGTQLNTGWIEGDDIRCRYHGWKYGPDGQCVEQPAEPEPFCEKIRIRSYPTQEYLGLVFAYFGEGDPPEFPRYPAFEQEGMHLVTFYDRACNYYNNLDNDSIHTYFTHYRTHRSWKDGLPRLEAEETESGVTNISIWPDGRRTRGQHLMPNISYRISYGRVRSSTGQSKDVRVRVSAGRGNNIAWRVPIDDQHHRVFAVEWFPFGEEAERYIKRRKEWLSKQTESVEVTAAKVFRGEMHLDDIPVEGGDVHNINHIEDAATQVGQGAIADRENEHLGRTDVGVFLQRKIWQRELRALAEGRPLKRWVPPGLNEVSG